MRTYKKWLIGGVAALLIVVLVLGGLWATNALGWRAWRLQEVQNFIGTNLPEGTANPRFFTQNQQTRIVWLRFEIPSGADLTPFLNSMGVQTLKDGFTPFPAANPQEAAISWWTPSAATTYSGVYKNDGRIIREVLLDTSDAAHPVVYLRAYNIAKS